MLDLVSSLPPDIRQIIIKYLPAEIIQILILFEGSWFDLLLVYIKSKQLSARHSFYFLQSDFVHDFLFIYHLSPKLAIRGYQKLNIQDRVRLVSFLLQDQSSHKVARTLGRLERQEDSRHQNANYRIFDRFFLWRFQMMNCPIGHSPLQSKTR